MVSRTVPGQVSGLTYGGLTYGDVIAEAFGRFAEREAFVDGDRRVSYAESADLTGRIQRLLVELGLGRGGALGALSPNTPEVYFAQAATFLLGARYSGLHPLGSVADHVFLCDDAGIEVLVVHPDFAETGAAIAEQARTVRHLLTLGPAEVGQDLIAACAGMGSAPLRAPVLNEEEIAWVQYTGGTTGRPKGAMLSHRALVQQVQSCTISWGLPERPRYLASSPITHAAVLPVLPTLARGGTVVLHRSFDPEHWLRTVAREKVNYAFVVPTMLYTMLDRADPGRFDTSSLDSLVYGAAPMSPARIAETQDVFGPVVMQAYGQTECIGMATTLRKDEHDPLHRPRLLSSCGRSVAGVRVELLDDDGTAVPHGEVGELSVRSRVLMSGYRGRPEETAEVLRDGWLRTGDMAMRDPEGFLHIVDRKKDMIVTGGFNVFPKEVEDVIAAEAGVSAVAVIGVPDDHWGEAVTAFVVVRPGAVVDPDQLRAAVRARKGAHQTPKRVEIVPELPMTAVGKVDKKALRTAHWSGQQRFVH
ncbi:MAG: fatty-acyl-CoA synthase [Pseudonocardiales bacterium]|nr:fatty-acyl-CoA synthase [Pseudonocardiales bacterium]